MSSNFNSPLQTLRSFAQMLNRGSPAASPVDSPKTNNTPKTAVPKFELDKENVDCSTENQPSKIPDVPANIHNESSNGEKACPGPSPSRYTAIAELDDEDEDEKWRERNLIITRSEHEENVNNARQILLEIIGKLQPRTQENVKSGVKTPLKQFQEPAFEVSSANNSFSSNESPYRTANSSMVSNESDEITFPFMDGLRKPQSDLAVPSPTIDNLADCLSAFTLNTPMKPKEDVKLKPKIPSFVVEEEQNMSFDLGGAFGKISLNKDESVIEEDVVTEEKSDVITEGENGENDVFTEESAASEELDKTLTIEEDEEKSEKGITNNGQIEHENEETSQIVQENEPKSEIVEPKETAETIETPIKSPTKVSDVEITISSPKIETETEITPEKNSETQSDVTNAEETPTKHLSNSDTNISSSEIKPQNEDLDPKMTQSDVSRTEINEDPNPKVTSETQSEVTETATKTENNPEIPTQPENTTQSDATPTKSNLKTSTLSPAMFNDHCFSPQMRSERLSDILSTKEPSISITPNSSLLINVECTPKPKDDVMDRLLAQQMLLEKDMELDRLTKEIQKADLEIQLLERERLDQKQSEQQMQLILSEFEDTVSEMLSGKERDKVVQDIEMEKIRNETMQILDDLNSAEKAFLDVNRKYERNKDVISSFQHAEDDLMNQTRSFSQRLAQSEEQYANFKAHAEGKVNLANDRIESLAKSKQNEVARLEAQIRTLEVKSNSFQAKLNSLEETNNELNDIIIKISSQK